MQTQIIRFLSRFLLFCVPVVCIYLFTLYKADGKIEGYYARFITPLQTSLVIGTSRAEQGIVPGVFNEIMQTGGKRVSLYNYAFDLGVSPFGKLYFNSIRQKLDTSSNNGVFIVCVDPWALSIEKQLPDNDSGQEENVVNNSINNNYVHTNPNPYFLIEHYPKGWGNILLDEYSGHPSQYMHKDGWLEVSVSMDSTVTARRTHNRVEIYRTNYLNKYRISTSRLNYLKQTISFLQQHGTVILVRLPVGPDMFKLEQTYSPNFEMIMQMLSTKMQAQYLSFAGTGANYRFTDGHHMYKGSSAIFTTLLADTILARKLIK